MRPVMTFELDAISGPDEPARSRLVRDGRAVADIEGIVLEGQFDVGDGRMLVVTSDGVPHEDFAHLRLVGATGEVLDSYDAGAPYASAFITTIDADGDVLKLTLADANHSVRYVPEGRICWPGTLPPAFRRALMPWSRAYLKIDRLPN